MWANVSGNEHHWKIWSRSKQQNHFVREKKQTNKPWNYIRSYVQREKKTSFYWMDIIKMTTKQKTAPVHMLRCDCVLHDSACIGVCLWLIVTIDDNHSIQLILSYFSICVPCSEWAMLCGVALSFSVRMKLTGWLIADFDFSLFNTRIFFSLIKTTGQRNR